MMTYIESWNTLCMYIGFVAITYSVQSVQKPKCEIIFSLRYSFSSFCYICYYFSKSEQRKKVAELCTTRATIFVARALFFLRDTFSLTAILFFFTALLFLHVILFFITVFFVPKLCSWVAGTPESWAQALCSRVVERQAGGGLSDPADDLLWHGRLPVLQAFFIFILRSWWAHTCWGYQRGEFC